MGDLRSLAASIDEQGLLQPIGVDRDMNLVFGERRLCACRDMLGWVEIDARTVDVTSIVEGEYHENEIRLAFTPEERVHIGRAVETEIGNRQGQRTDTEHVEKIPQVEDGVKTRQVAAQRAGFGNDRTYRQAREIVEAATKFWLVFASP